MAVDSLAAGVIEPSPAAPPSPRGRNRVDTALTVIGEILITAGVLLGLFVVWQLFYTDVQSGREQDAVLNSLDWVEPVVGVGQANSSGEITGELTVIPLIPEELKTYSPDGAPVMAQPEHTATFATLYVPRWGSDYIKPISQGVTRRDVLDRLGIGHYPNTAMPGAVGNFAIAGHRTTYGKPFADIDLLQVGDSLVVQTEDTWYVYKVTTMDIVAPTFVQAIADNPFDPSSSASTAMITLTSCHPKFSAAQRYIVHGDLVYWAPTGHGFPSEIVESA
jgi:sortase A